MINLGERFDFDEITRFGNPWHGYRVLATGDLMTDADVAISGPVVDHLPDDGWNRFSDLGATAVQTSEADAAVGMTWLNRAVWTGFNKRVAAVHSPGGDGTTSVGATAWPYRAPDGQVWWLEAGIVAASPTELKIFARKMPTPDDKELGVDAVEIVSLGINVGEFSNSASWVNFAPDGSAATIYSGFRRPWGDSYQMQLWETEITNGTATEPPDATLALCTVDFMPDEDVIYTPLQNGYVTYSAETLNSNDPDPYPFTGPFTRWSITGAVTGGNDDPSGQGYRETRDTTVAMGIVYSGSGNRHVIKRRERRLTEEYFVCNAADGYLDSAGVYNNAISITGTYADLSNSAEVSWTEHYLSTLSLQILLDDAVIVDVEVRRVERVNNRDYSGSGSPGYGSESNEAVTDIDDEKFVDIPLGWFLVNGETVVLVATDDPRAIVAWGNSRGGGQFPEESLPQMASAAGFSTHPFTGIFDPEIDRYF
jgi:hypothetical protein